LYILTFTFFDSRRFHKMLGNYWVAAQFVASWVVLSSTELVS
jgi:hypothetical protein